MGNGKDEENQKQKNEKMVLNKKAQAAMLQMMQQLQELAKYLTKLEETTQQDKGFIAQLYELRAEIDGMSSDVKQKGYVNASKLDAVTLKMEEVARNSKNIVFVRNIDKAKARLAARPGANLMQANPVKKSQNTPLNEESKEKEALQKMQQNILAGLKIFSKDKIFELQRAAQTLKNESKKQSKIDRFIHATKKWFSHAFKNTIGSLLQKSPPKAQKLPDVPKSGQGKRPLPKKPHNELLKEEMDKRQQSLVSSDDIDQQQAERRRQQKASKNPQTEAEDLKAQPLVAPMRPLDELEQLLSFLEKENIALKKVSTVAEHVDGPGMTALKELLADLESSETSTIRIEPGEDPTHDEALSILDNINKDKDDEALDELDKLVAQHEVERQQDKDKLQARSNISQDARRHSMTVAREVQEKQHRRQSIPPKVDVPTSIKPPGGKKK
jgi:hypothetical protein